MPSRRHFVVGTAGHIDHGKTELVRALTGIDTDRLPEEKERGITIDIGFASLDLGPTLHIALIDVPGHERFVKNMLAGVGGIDLVLLVVAADESVMPQTREHFEICSLLGVRRGIVALTKIDLASDDLRELAEIEIREFLGGSLLEGAPIVPVSARTGEGIDALREALAAAVGEMQPRTDSGLCRLPVDRAFSIRGFGTVVTGTLFTGSVQVGDELMLYPRAKAVRVRRVEVHGQEAERARAGERAALNLQGLDVTQVRRGTVLASPGTFRSSSLVDVRIELLHSAPAPLKDLSRVRYHLGTAEVLARVKLLGRDRLSPGEAGFAQLRLEEPYISLPGDRFILRRYSPTRTIGGGVVLDPVPAKHRGASTDVSLRLARLAEAEPLERLVLVVDAAGPAGARAAELQERTGISVAELAPLLEGAANDGRLLRTGDPGRPCYLSVDEARRLEEAATALLAEFHAEHPLEAGLGKEELRRRVFGGCAVDAFRGLLDGLVARGTLTLEGDRVRLASHRLKLSGEEERHREAIEEGFRRGGLNPPSLAQIVEDAGIPADRGEALFHVLARAGALIRVRGGLTFHADALDDLRRRLLSFREQSETIDVATFKDLSGTTRKNAIPLLEYLDAQRVTLRRGNERVILPAAGS